MKRSLSKLLALVLIVTLIGAMAAVPAMASTPTEFEGYTAIGGTATFNKVLEVKSGSSVPDVTFYFTVKDTNDDTIANPSVSFSSSDQTTPGASSGDPDTVTKSVTITFPSDTFTRPGEYTFTLAETNGNDPGVTYDSKSVTLHVYVTDDDGVLNFASCIFGNGEDKTDTFTNRFVNLYDSGFTKAVTGNQGDKSKEFTFTLSISNAAPGTYQIESNTSGAPTSITVDNSGTYTGTFTMKDGSSVKVLGLNEDAVCTVSEDADGYDASYADGSGSSVTGTSYTTTLTDDTTVAFTNTLEGNVPTGILLTVAPFAIGLLLFGSLVIFLVAKKRRAEEED